VIFRLSIEVENDAFQTDAAREVARILRKVSIDLEDRGLSTHWQPTVDENGNTVGRYALRDDD
jgi:hypothetical protein